MPHVIATVMLLEVSRVHMDIRRPVVMGETFPAIFSARPIADTLYTFGIWAAVSDSSRGYSDM